MSNDRLNWKKIIVVRLRVKIVNSNQRSVSAPFAKVIRRRQELLLAWKELTLYIIEMSFDAFANKADPDQAALIQGLLSTLFAY